ncbi:MAG: ABC transporter permease [Clostridia bacterium]|nr:ABC transporter permease [Clostridia bacterium]
MLIFWTYLFPIILGTFFNLAFSNIENSEKLEIIKIAIVENDKLKSNTIFQEAFETLSDEENEDRLFSTQYVSEEEAKQLLQNNEIIGYMILEEEPKIIIQSSGINETILKYVTEEIMQNTKMINELAENEIQAEIAIGNISIDYHKIYQNVRETIQQEEANIKNIAKSNLSYTMIEFYTLIAMSCLYGGILGMVAINQKLANMSDNGKRVSIAPTKKGKVVLSSLLAGYIAQIIGLAILFAYTILVLKVDFGTNLPLILLLGIVGSLAGLTMGLAIGTVVKANEGLKTGILISVTMLGSFLSGMMGITMKYIIDKNLPILNQINPANMITDGFYALYYYDTLDRFYFNLVSLLLFSGIMLIISYTSLRRQKYDSI